MIYEPKQDLSGPKGPSIQNVEGVLCTSAGNQLPLAPGESLRISLVSTSLSGGTS